MKKALLLNAIDPAIGGVLIRGDRGTAKSSAVRALGRLLPDYEAVDQCPYRCDPAIPSRYCDECRRRANSGRLPVVRLPMRIVELPINASEDRLVGSIDIEAAVRAGTGVSSPAYWPRPTATFYMSTRSICSTTTSSTSSWTRRRWGSTSSNARECRLRTQPTSSWSAP